MSCREYRNDATPIPIRMNAPYCACRRSRMRWRLPLSETYVSHRLLTCQRRGPGNFARGCHGESRYATEESATAAVYAAAKAVEVQRAWSASDGSTRSVMYKAAHPQTYATRAVSPEMLCLLRIVQVSYTSMSALLRQAGVHRVPTHEACCCCEHVERCKLTAHRHCVPTTTLGSLLREECWFRTGGCCH